MALTGVTLSLQKLKMIDKSKVKFTIITAGGKGLRMGLELPKQYALLKGLPVLMHTVKRFHQFDRDMKIVLSLPTDSRVYWDKLCQKHNFKIPHQIVQGGATRFHSVQNALAHLPHEGLTAVHDGVRPLVSTETITAAFAAAEAHGAAVPVHEIPFSLRRIEGDTSMAVARSKYREVQTPQVFRNEMLHEAYALDYREGFTDDASMVEAAGYSVVLSPGNPENLKITYPSDLAMAEALIPKIL